VCVCVCVCVCECVWVCVCVCVCLYISIYIFIYVYIYTEPVVPASPRHIMTNSAKYAHYAPALVRRRVRFGDLETCLEVACSGAWPSPPAWMAGMVAEGGRGGAAGAGRGGGRVVDDGLCSSLAAATAAFGSCPAGHVAQW